MMKAATEVDAKKSKESFEKLFSDKYPKAIECLSKSWAELTTFFHHPAQHWQHIRTTNPIESSFATVKLRTKVTKGAGSKETAAVMAFKHLKGVEYKNGLMIPYVQHHEHAAS